MASGLLPSKLIVFPALNVKIKHYLLQIYSISGVEGEAKEEEGERRIGRLPGIKDKNDGEKMMNTKQQKR
jgi:hypothetical protein